eukprot:TRINITY_DN13027_c1_g1_i1.p1 TRINITY_DN13027_c1_g1~~TRINITY_DN13027_c1_g1_i1.p1  ORF type:complete len:420 (+),score=59.02 TRINITY_DN13027_c1_g1_i1:264-1523(+)
MGSISVWVSPPPGTWGGFLAQSGLFKHVESGILSQPYYPLLLSWGMANSEKDTPSKVVIGGKASTFWLLPRSLGAGFEAEKTPLSSKTGQLRRKFRIPQCGGCHVNSPKWRSGSLMEKSGVSTRSLQLRRRLTKSKLFTKCRRSLSLFGQIMCVLPKGLEGDGEALGSSKSEGGRIVREVLYSQARTKMDYTPDADFYTFPRFVTHVDATFLRTLTTLYRQRLPPGGEILDLMSSWVSHLPLDVTYKRVIGHGMNALELSKNKDLTEFFVKDLNQEPKLERADKSLDAVICTVSVQYLEQPEKVFAEIYRVLRPGGICIISFSNRMFYQKAIATWRDGTMYSRTQLVKDYFRCVRGFTEPEVVREVQPVETIPSTKKTFVERSKQMMENFSKSFRSKTSDPFVAVIAYRNYRPLHQTES